MVVTAERHEPARDSEPVERVLATARGDAPGPTLVCVGGVHGNEPAGVHAIHRVGRRLDRAGVLSGGAFLGLVGNRIALERGVRFVEHDLNRAWTDDQVSGVRSRGSGGGEAEAREQAELLAEIDRAVAEARGPVHLLDLHTTSGPGGLFSAFGDTLPQRFFAAGFPVPMVLGLEELVDGTLAQFFSERGLIAVTLETGRHDAPEAVERAEAAIWVALSNLGVLAREAGDAAEHGERVLAEASAHLPRALEMRHRHPVRTGDGFEMEPGYRNFDPVARGDLIARDRTGEVHAGMNGRLLLPLYQHQGEDGFFLVRDFNPFRMAVSTGLRRARADRIARLLPGVHGVPNDPHAVAVDRRVARFYAKQFFHLLGFRKVEEDGPRLVMRRRAWDRPGRP